MIEAIALAPMEVPRRATRVKVAWQGGTVTEIDVARPHRRQLFRTPPAAAERLRALAAAGCHDEEIAERHDFQAHRRVWWLDIPEETAARLERLAAPLRDP